MIFGAPLTAPGCRILPYDTHAAFNASIFLSLGVSGLPSLEITLLFLRVFFERVEELGVSDWSSN